MRGYGITRAVARPDASNHYWRDLVAVMDGSEPIPGRAMRPGRPSLAGTMAGTVTRARTPRGRAWSFGGSSALAWDTIATETALQGLGAGSFTYLAVFVPTGGVNAGGVITLSDLSSNNDANIRRHDAASGTNLVFQWYTGAAFVSIDLGIPFASGKVHAVVGTYDYATTTGRAYVDGRLAGTGTGSRGTTKATKLQLGRNGSTSHWVGSILLAAIWNRSLAPGEAQQLSIEPFEPFLRKRPLYAYGQRAYPVADLVRGGGKRGG